jgi:hypothetical protein
MCVLRVSGRSFDPDSYLAACGLRAYKVFHAGEPEWKSRPEGKRHDASGFRVDVSRESDLAAQVRDAVKFLDEFRDVLSKLTSISGVEDMRLDFPVDLRIDRQKIMAQFDYFPPELISKAGALGLGIEVSLYPPDLEDLARARAAKRSKSLNSRIKGKKCASEVKVRSTPPRKKDDSRR